MPQIGWFEILIIVIMAILILGPKDFPIMVKKVGQWFGTFKRYIGEIQSNVTTLADVEDVNLSKENKKEDLISNQIKKDNNEN